MRFSHLCDAVLAMALTLGFCGAFLAIDQVAYSQVTTAAIHGTVTDPSGAVVPDAKITALNVATGISTETTANQSGYYVFPALQVGGPYRITVVAPGFMKFESTGVMLRVNADLEIGAMLKIGSSLETITVNAEAVQVETSNTQLQQNVPASQLENLPMLGRDAASMSKLAPGVVESSDRFGSYSANGSQTSNNSYVLEGIDNNDGPLQTEGMIVNPDALAEENIVSSTINPEFARNSGSIINQVIKSGTNTIHGSGFEYYRDNFLNLPGYFALPGERTPYHQNLFGGTLGGPIIKNRLFGFAAYQGYRRTRGAIQQTPVFQNGVVSSGIFTNEQNAANGGANGTVGLADNPIPFDITTGDGIVCGPGTQYANWTDCFPAGSPVVISPGSFNPIALALAKQYVPGGNAGTSAAPYYNFSTSNTRNQDQGLIRADFRISSSDSIYGVGLFESTPSVDALPFYGSTLPGFSEVATRHYKLFAAQETHSFSPNTLNVLRGGYYRLNYVSVVPQKPVAPSDYGFNINPQTPLSGLPTISLTGLFTLGSSPYGPQPRKDTNLTFSDNFTHVAGSHELKFGVTIEQFRVSNPYYSRNSGSFDYSGSGQYSSGDPGIDFLLGIPDSFTQSSGGFVDAMAWEYYAFAQDSWHATSDLTVNYGLAWDVETPYSNNQFGGLGITCFELSNRTSNVFPGGFPGLLFPGDSGCNKSGGAKTKWAHFGPRIGFAWSPSSGPSALIGEPGAHRFSVRAGFGVYYNRDQETAQLQNLGDVPNYIQSYGALDFGGSPAFANPYQDVSDATQSRSNPFPYVRPKPGTALDWSQFVEQDISAIDRNYTVPYVYNFNLNVQRQLPGNMVMQVGYVGSLGRRLPMVYEGNPITPAGHAACLQNADCRGLRTYQHLYFPENAAQPSTTYPPYPDYLSVGTVATYGASNYNSFQASLVKNTSHGLYFTTAYTYSHGLDNASGLESSGFNGLGYNWVPGFQYLSYGDSDYDARHRLAASYDYQIPLLASMNQNIAVKKILGDWHVAGMTALQSGFPVTITNAGTYNSMWCDYFSYYSCPDNVQTSSFNIKKFNPRANVNDLNQYFDSSSFTQEPVGTFGNAKRNFFHGPGYNYTNMSIYKNIPFGRSEARGLYIALQAANVFNHANFAPPDANFTDGPYFGTVYAVGGGGADNNSDPAPGRTVELTAKIRF